MPFLWYSGAKCTARTTASFSFTISLFTLFLSQHHPRCAKMKYFLILLNLFLCKHPLCASSLHAQAPTELLRTVKRHILPISFSFHPQVAQAGCLRLSRVTEKMLARRGRVKNKIFVNAHPLRASLRGIWPPWATVAIPPPRGHPESQRNNYQSRYPLCGHCDLTKLEGRRSSVTVSLRRTTVAVWSIKSILLFPVV